MEFEGVNNSELVPDTREKILDFYFSVRAFLNTYELLDDKYIIYSDYSEDGNFRLRLQCMDPSTNLDSYLKKEDAVFSFQQHFFLLNIIWNSLPGEQMIMRSMLRLHFLLKTDL